MRAGAAKAVAPLSNADSSGTAVIYRCEDGNGMVTLRSRTPCLRGERAKRSVVALPQPAAPVIAPQPAPIATATATGAPVAVLEATVVNAPATPRDLITLPPPALYRCTTPASAAYLSETESTAERCRALPVFAAAANATTLAGLDPSQTCVNERDTCVRIPDQDVCAAWDQRLLEAKAMVELGDPELSPKAAETRARVERVLRETTCAGRQNVPIPAPAPAPAQTP